MRWTYCVTTCPQRMNTLLRQTLESLKQGGFPYPWVFALVFSRDALVTLLSSRSLVEKCLASEERTRLKRIDGGIVNAMNLAGWSEYVHDPSLVQHTGVLSTVGNQPHPEAESFPGETFDALHLLS
jgi:hypothetical protein